MRTNDGDDGGGSLSTMDTTVAVASHRMAEDHCDICFVSLVLIIIGTSILRTDKSLAWRRAPKSLQGDETDVVVEDYSVFTPMRGTNRSLFTPGRLIETEGWDFNFPSTCAASDAKEWRFCDPEPCTEPKRVSKPIIYPPRTAQGRDTVDFIQEVLRKAWGSDPPLIDFYVRAGCGASEKLQYLLETVHLFWPSFLGKVLVVLDFNDRAGLDGLIPARIRRSHQLEVVYEHAPCMDGRLFNQYSYLNLFRYSVAEYVVTIDSDCALHVPVTPDLLFNRNKQLILPVSRKFQQEYDWDDLQLFFTGVSFHKLYGHPMITQPVNFHVLSTFEPYLEWIQRTRGTCYEDLLIDLPRKKTDIYFFCWMCQLAVFLANVTGGSPTPFGLYDLHDVDSRNDVYLRYAIHVSYEMAHGKDYGGTVQQVVDEGLCRWYGRDIFPNLCPEMPRTNFITQVTVHYAQLVILRNVSYAAVGRRIREGKARLRKAIVEVLTES